MVVAVRLGLDSRDCCSAGRPTPGCSRSSGTEIEDTPGVDGLLELLTMHMGPDHLIVAAGSRSATRSRRPVEELSERIDRRLSERLPVTSHVFIDPTDTARGSRGPLLPEPDEASR